MNQAAGTSAPIYVSSDIDWVHRIWRFYAIADGRMDMIDRAVYVAFPPVGQPGESFFLYPTGSALEGAAQALGWSEVTTVKSIDGSRSFTIGHRNRSLPPPLMVP